MAAFGHYDHVLQIGIKPHLRQKSLNFQQNMPLLLGTKIPTFLRINSIPTYSISVSLMRLGGIRYTTQESSSSPPPPKTNDPKDSPSNDPKGSASSNTIINLLNSTRKDTSNTKSNENKSKNNYVLELLDQAKNRKWGSSRTSPIPQTAGDPQKLNFMSSLRSGIGVTATTNARGESHTLHIHATANNTIVTLNSALDGGMICWSSGGSAGFKKSARSGFEAANQAAIQLLDKIEKKNVQVDGIHIVLKGFGPGRDAAVKALLEGSSWRVMRITDATPIPFNGCRPRKQRRL